jgi:hypothetical protein
MSRQEKKLPNTNSIPASNNMMHFSYPFGVYDSTKKDLDQ